MPGGKQTVPRGELWGAIGALKRLHRATRPVTIWVDCLDLAKGWEAGPKAGRTTNADLWEMFWNEIGNTPTKVRVRKVWKSHATAKEMAAGLITRLEAFGNTVADDLAKAGADLHQLARWEVERVRKIDALAWKVQTRLVETYILHAEARDKHTSDTNKDKAKPKKAPTKGERTQASVDKLVRQGHIPLEVTRGKNITYRCERCGVNVGTKWLKRWAEADKQCAAGAMLRQDAACDAEQSTSTGARSTAEYDETRLMVEPTRYKKEQHKTFSHDAALGRMIRRTNADAGLDAKSERGGGQVSEEMQEGTKSFRRMRQERGAGKRSCEACHEEEGGANQNASQHGGEQTRKHHKTDIRLDYGFDDEEGPNQSEGEWTEDDGGRLEAVTRRHEPAEGEGDAHTEQGGDGQPHQGEVHGEESQDQQGTNPNEEGGRRNNAAPVDSARQMTLIDYLRECSKGSERPGQPRPPPQEVDSQRAAEEKRRRIEKATSNRPATEVQHYAHKANQKKTEGNLRLRLIETLARGKRGPRDEDHSDSPEQCKQVVQARRTAIETAQKRPEENEADAGPRRTSDEGDGREQRADRVPQGNHSVNSGGHQRVSGGTHEASIRSEAPPPAKRRKVAVQGEEYTMQYNGRQVHRSHCYGFSRGILWCWSCGAWCQNYARALTMECTKIPTRAGADALARLSKGMTPRSTMEMWPIPLALQPETVPIVQSPLVGHIRRRVNV